MAGATTREIMDGAGHKTMSQAARYYHLSPQHIQSVVDWIARTGIKKTNRHQNSHQANMANIKGRRNARKKLR